MPPRIRRLFLLGLALVLVGLLGLAAGAAGGVGRALPPMAFVPFYVAGSLLLVGTGIAWLVAWSRRPPPDR